MLSVKMMDDLLAAYSSSPSYKLIVFPDNYLLYLILFAFNNSLHQCIIKSSVWRKCRREMAENYSRYDFSSKSGLMQSASALLLESCPLLEFDLGVHIESDFKESK